MDSEDGRRVAEQGPWLQLLVSHLAGARVRSQLPLEDLVQEVFVRTLASAATPPRAEQGDGALRRYLAKVARSVVFDALRAQRAFKRQGEVRPITRGDYSRAGIQESQLAAVTAGPATRAVAGERRRHLRNAFLELSAEHRRVLGLRQFEGLSAAETAARMGRSTSAVHSLYRRALQEWSRRSGGAADEVL